METLPLGITEDFFSRVTNYVDDRLTNYARVMLVEIEELGTDSEGLPTARPSTPADDPAIQRPFYPLIGTATVGDWKQALTTGNGMVILGEAGAGGGGGPNPLPTGGAVGDAIRKESTTDYDVLWVTENYSLDAYNGAEPLTTYAKGLTTMRVTSATTGWPTSATYNIVTVRTDGNSGLQWASRDSSTGILFYRRWLTGTSVWGDWLEFAFLDVNGNLTANGLIVPEQASPATPAVNSGMLTVVDKDTFTEWVLRSSTGEIATMMRDSFFVGRNVSGVTITKGTAVKARGLLAGSGDQPTFDKADAAYNVGKVPAIGVTMGNVADGTGQRVMTFGVLTGLDTSAWAFQDVLYVSATTPGVLTNVAPINPHYAAEVGMVMSSHATDGTIIVNPTVVVKKGAAYSNLLTVSADVANSNAVANTLADVTGLSFAVLSGVHYKFRARILYDVNATTTGARFTLDGPAGMTRLMYMTTQSPVTGQVPVTTLYNTLNSPAAATTGSPNAQNNICIIEGFFIPSANGTAKIRFASEVASAAVTVKAGSSLEWHV